MIAFHLYLDKVSCFLMLHRHSLPYIFLMSIHDDSLRYTRLYVQLVLPNLLVCSLRQNLLFASQDVCCHSHANVIYYSDNGLFSR